MKDYVYSTTDAVYINGHEFCHFHTLHNRIRYEKERTIRKYRHRNERTLKDCAYRIRRYLSIRPLKLFIIRDNKRTLRDKLKYGDDTDKQLSLFKKINDYI